AGGPRRAFLLCESVRDAAGLLEEAVKTFRKDFPSLPIAVTILDLQCEVLRKVSSAAGSDEEKLGGLVSLAPLFREILPMLDAAPAAASAMHEVRYWLRELSEILARGADRPLPEDLRRSLQEVSDRADRLVE